MEKKILIVSLIVYILLIAPIINANTNKKGSNETMKNPEVKLVDNYEEIITIIEGSASGVRINRRGLIRDAELWGLGNA